MRPQLRPFRDADATGLAAWLDPFAPAEEVYSPAFLVHQLRRLPAARRKPLPRFWYLPNGKKAVVIMTGDDHAQGATAGRFDVYKSLSPAGCSVANWEIGRRFCLRFCWL